MLPVRRSIHHSIASIVDLVATALCRRVLNASTERGGYSVTKCSRAYPADEPSGSCRAS
jgi:hypothetical protein